MPAWPRLCLMPLVQVTVLLCSNRADSNPHYNSTSRELMLQRCHCRQLLLWDVQFCSLCWSRPQWTPWFLKSESCSRTGRGSLNTVMGSHLLSQNRLSLFVPFPQGQALLGKVAAPPVHIAGMQSRRMLCHKISGT